MSTYFKVFKLLFSLLFLIFPLILNSATYFVSPAGNNSNPGTLQYPWLTVTKAAQTLVAGDTVFVRQGTYNERVQPVNSGTDNNYVVYASYPGELAVIDGNGISIPAWEGLFELYQDNYIVIYGLRIINSDAAGILCESSDNLVIMNNQTYNTVSSGIGVWDSKNILIDSNEVELACNDGEQECISVAMTDSFEICYNHVHHNGPGSNGGEGIDAKDGASNGLIHHNIVHDLTRLGIYVDAWDKHTYNIEVYNNVVYNCSAYGFVVASEAGGLLENVKIYNNLAYNNRYVGISITGHGLPVPNHPIHNIIIINNTVYKNGWISSGWGGGINIEESADVENIIIRNNICSKNLSFQIADEVGVSQYLTVDYNLIDGFMGYPGEMYGSDSVVGDPLFVDTIIYNLHITENSPAVDVASSVFAPVFDYDGNPRPSGSGYDIGAYEYITTGVNEIPISVNDTWLTLKIINNSTDSEFIIEYTLPYDVYIDINLYNLSGQLIEVLECGNRQKGQHRITWNTDDNRGETISSGLYFVNLKTENEEVTEKIFLLN